MLSIKQVKIFHEISRTAGSGPLLCTLSEDGLWYCKKSMYAQPYTDIINEIILHQLIMKWGIRVPEICLLLMDYNQFSTEIKKDFDVIASKLSQGMKLNFHYTSDKLGNYLFGSKQVLPNFGMLSNSLEPDRINLKDYLRPEDMLKIAFFDLWTGNKDRKPSNPNILTVKAEKGYKSELMAIDHCQAFFKSKNYLDLPYTNESINFNESMLSGNFAKVVLARLSPAKINSLVNDFCRLQSDSEEILDSIYSFVPNSWGLDDTMKIEINRFLFCKERNDSILESYNSFLQLAK